MIYGSTYKEYRLDLNQSLTLLLHDKKMMLELKIIGKKFGYFKSYAYLCTQKDERCVFLVNRCHEDTPSKNFFGVSSF